MKKKNTRLSGSQRLSNSSRVSTGIILGAALLCEACELVAGETNIVVQESLNRRWAGQLVSYPFQAGEGQCVAGSVDLTGPAGRQAVQLYDLTYWPDGQFVQSGRIAFVVEELKPLTQNTYTLQFGRKPTPAVAGGVQVKTEASYVEISTPRIAARVPVGSRSYEAPVPPDQVPPPISGLRISDEPWFGEGCMYGDVRIRGWSAKLVDRGPVFSRVESRYEYEDGTVLTVHVQASSGGNTVRVDMDVQGEQPGGGWRLVLAPNPPFRDMQNVYGIGSWMRENNVKIPAESGEKPLAYLSPWAGDYWFPDSPAIIRLRRDQGNRELQLCVRDVADWVNPQAKPSWSNFATWSNALVTVPYMWSGWQNRRIPLFADKDGAVRMQVNLMSGRRHWTMTSDTDGTNVMNTFLRKEITTHCNLPLLDEVKDMVLDWPDAVPATVPADTGAPVSGDSILDTLGNLDLFRMNERHGIFHHCTRLLGAAVSPAQRRLNKAQMAYLAYMSADPRHWSFERGYSSGNPNMTATRVCNIGLFGLTLKGHPMSREWFEYANGWMKYWMAETVTEKGYWPESAHYTEVSIAAMRHFAGASSRNDGYRVAEDPRYKAMMQFYYGRIATPSGSIVPYGRGIGSNLGGSRQADWTSEHIPHFGFILRSHATTPRENYLLYLPYRAQCADGEIWPHQVASIASWYAGGKPVAGWHPAKRTRADWAFEPHVRIDGIAKEGTFAKSRSNGFALLPCADYISSSFSYAGDPAGPSWGCHCGGCPKNPLAFRGAIDDYAWTTQLLLVGDRHPEGINYLILRDSLDIERASQWTFPAVPGALESYVVSPAQKASDGFNLQLPGRGAYYAALIPASSGTVERATLADGRIIRLAGVFGTDYCFLGGLQRQKVSEGGVAFEGTAGAILDRAMGLMLVLSAPGMVRYKDYGISGEIPAALSVEAAKLLITCSEPWSGGEVTLLAPGRWELGQGTGAGLVPQADGRMKVSIPAGVRQVELRKTGN